MSEIRLSVKEATARMLLGQNDLVNVARRNMERAEEVMQTLIRPLLAENGLVQGKVLEVTECEPYEMVVEVET